MAKLCPACSKANPATANYCYYDGRHLSNEGDEGPLQVGTLPFPMPFCFADGQGCANFNQLALACDARWDEARGLLADGTWHSFFSAMGRLDLAVAAKQAVKEPDLDVGLSQLLEKFPAEALRRPQLALPSTEENLGALTPGTDHRFDLVITNRGLLVLRGMATTNCEWLSLGDGTGAALKMFQTRGVYTLPVRVLGNKLRAGVKPLQGEIVIDTNGGAITLPVRADIPVRPFPSGTHANDALAGVKSPRELALKAKAHPLEAAVLFEQGAVKAWYASNGWTYPVEGTQASGKSAVQQFFEALGLTKPPRLEIDTERLRCVGKVGQRLTKHVTISTQEPRAVYAQAGSNRPWITVGPAKLQGKKVTIPLEIEVPPCPGETVRADVTFQGNGKQQFVVPVTLMVLATPVDATAKAVEPSAGLPLGWIFAVVGLLFVTLLLVVAVGVGTFVIMTRGKGKQEERSEITDSSPPPTLTPTATTPTPPPALKNEERWDGITDTMIASILELKAIAPQDETLFDGLTDKDEFQRGEAYDKLAAQMPKLLGNPKAKDLLSRLLVECCVFDSDYCMAHLLRALTSQLPRKDTEFRPEENGEEPERGLWSLQVFFAALTHKATAPERSRKLTEALQDVFELNPDEKPAPDELKAQTENLLALRCYRNTLPTAQKSLDHALAMRDKLSKMFPQHLPPAVRATVDVDLIAIGLAKGNDAWPKLEPIVKTCLESTDPAIGMKIADLRKKVVPAVAQKMEQLAATVRIEALIDKLKNADSQVRREAAHTLADMGPSAKPAVVALVARLRIETETDVLAELARALGQIRLVPKDAIDALQAKATHTDAAVRLQVIKALLNLGPEAVPASALCRFMGDDSEDIRKCVDEALTSRFISPAPGDLRGAIDALKDSDAKVRRQASRALGLSGPDAKEAAPSLCAMLRTEKESAVLAEAARSLGLIRSDSKEVLDALGEQANHTDAAVRLSVLDSLFALQGKRISLRFLFRFAEDSNRTINQRAETAFMARLKSATEADVPDLRQGLNSKSATNRRAVAEALGRLGKAAEAAADDLVPSLESSYPLVRMEAAIALVRVNPKHEDAVKKAVPILVAAFGHQPGEEESGAEWTDRCERARNAVMTLGRPAVRELVDAIGVGGQFSAVKSRPADNPARIEVYRTLKKLGAAAKLEAARIADVARRETNHDVKDEAARALEAVNDARP